MKIFGDGLNPVVPFKTFLLSAKDTAEWIVRETLDKYGLKHGDAHSYCLVQVIHLTLNAILQVFLCPCPSKDSHSSQ